MTRTRPAETAAEDSTPATAKKTAAKKAPARKTTARKTAAATRPARQRTRTATAPALSLVKPDTAPPAKKTTAKKAVTRAAAKKTSPWPEFITHKAITAHYQARLHGLPTRTIRDWKESRGTATITFPTGARIDHTPAADAPFHAHTPCKNGGVHYDPIHTLQDLHAAEQAAASCTDRHGAPAALALGASLNRAKTTTADTQPMSTDAITEGLAERAADTEQPKEHPEP